MRTMTNSLPILILRRLGARALRVGPFFARVAGAASWGPTMNATELARQIAGLAMLIRRCENNASGFSPLLNFYRERLALLNAKVAA